jgi:hypothetical protein
MLGVLMQPEQPGSQLKQVSWARIWLEAQAQKPCWLSKLFLHWAQRSRELQLTHEDWQFRHWSPRGKKPTGQKQLLVAGLSL